MKLRAIVVGLALLAGCEHTKKDDAGGVRGSASGGGGAKTVNGNDKMPAVPSDAVKPPTKDDLATYLAKVPGNGSKLMATMETNLGTFHCELYPQQAPMTIANFVGLATGQKAWVDPRTSQTMTGKPYFDGLIFHRVIPGFMIQGGDPLGQGNGGPGYNFDDEFDPSLTMQPGTLAMANAGPGTNGSQFFITEGSPAHLNGKHTIFGKCAEVDLVTKIEGVPRDRRDKPNDPVTIVHLTFSKE